MQAETPIMEELETNAIYCGDNLDVMKQFPSESVDLIYADPPFYSNKPYELIWHDGSERLAFDDRWKGGILHYIEWMESRIIQCQRLLKRTGCMYLHCDTHANHHLRLLMDKRFGEGNFVSEVYWYYYNKMHDYRKKVWPKATDTLLMYAKDRDSDYTFHMIEEDREKPVRQLMRKKVAGRMVNVKDAQGHVQYRVRDKKIVDNVWRISMLQPADKTERTGYPTQKPEALLDRIIRASSNPDDLVLDPFCGCGTTLLAAQKMKDEDDNPAPRKWIGIDISPTACTIMDARLTNLGISPRLVGMPITIDSLRKLSHPEFQDWVVQRLFGQVSAHKSSDMGIDGYTPEGYPVQVKQSEHVGRNVIDNFETAMRRIHASKGVIVAFSFVRSVHEEASRARLDNEADIRLLTVEELLGSESSAPRIEELPSLPEPNRTLVNTK